jgi:type IV pilus assembly protein PilB
MPAYDDKKLYEALKELAIINPNHLDDAFNLSQSRDLSFYQILIEKGLISDQNLSKTLADILHLPYVNLSQKVIDPKILKILPEDFARKERMVAFALDKNNKLSVALSDPNKWQALQNIAPQLKHTIKVFIATPRDVTESLELYAGNIHQAFEQLIQSTLSKTKKSAKMELPIVKVVEIILNYAARSQASDIHIEPQEETLMIRFRIDGILHDIVKIPKDNEAQIISRLKVLAKLRTDEHSKAQDGKFEFKVDDEEIDVRVSIVPISEGEKVVMRLLSENSRQYSLQDLGLSSADREKIESVYRKPYGMVLSTGPTGSGKTTTLYAILKLLNKREINIMTIEDPVEYNIEGVNQIQVNPKTNLTFAAGLRSIVRQDPDIILVGEIRDEETASIAINSAMTGHLVLSTLHTNDAATSIPRLLDFSIEPFLLATTVNVVVAQRLVRKICQKCRVSHEFELKDIKSSISQTVLSKHFSISKKNKIRAYYGKGCDLCHNTGYIGRIGIFEVMTIDDAIRKAVADKLNAAEITKIAVEQGMTTMVEDGLEKVKQGLTTFEEIVRTTKE